MLTSQANEKRRIGMNCPGCEAFIKMTIADLLTGSPIRCPNVECGNVLRVKKSASQSSLRVLSEFRSELQQMENN